MANRTRRGSSGGSRARKPAARRAVSSDKKGLASLKGKKRVKDDKTDDEILELLPEGLGRVFIESKLHEKHIKQAGLQTPDDFEGAMPQLPEDVAAVSHNELSNLLCDFQNAHATATWQTSMWHIEYDTMEELADYTESKALLRSNQSNEGKRKAEASTDDLVVFFRAKHKIAYHNFLRFRDLAGTINGKIKTVSRVGGFKDDEEEASNMTARPKLGRRNRRKNHE